MEMLWCSTCKRYLPISNFRKNAGRRSGYSSNCKLCERKWENTESGKYKSYRRNAKQRGLEFNLTKEEFVELIKSDCKYCGEKANPFNGIDRVDNNEGYIISNCVPCCEWCNKIKMSHSESDMIAHVEKMYKHLFGD